MHIHFGSILDKLGAIAGAITSIIAILRPKKPSVPK